MTRMLNAYLLRSVAVAALGGLLFGFDTAVISGVTSSLTTMFNLSVAELGATVSAALCGTVVGAMGAGVLGQRFGSHSSMIILGICYMLCAVGCAFSSNWPGFLLFRFIGGLGIGGSSVVGPVYIAEIAPASWRGRLVGAFQINIVVGILAAYLSNALIGLASLGAREWRWQLGIAAAPAALFLLMLVGTPPSARWLAMRNRTEEAKAVLRKLGSPDPVQELRSMVSALESQSTTRTERLFQWKYRRPIALAVGLAMFNQLVGINAVLYYLNDIFAMAGFDRATQNLQAVAVGAVNLAGTLAALSLIDRLGRGMLLLIGSVGLAACLAGIGAILAFHEHAKWLLLLVVGYVGFFAFSQGAVIWVYLSEIFPGRVRAQGQSLGSTTHWVMNALVAAEFPLLAAHSKAAPFMLFLVMVILQFVAVLLFYPETSGVTLEKMQERVAAE